VQLITLLIWGIFTLSIVIFANHHRTASFTLWDAAQRWMAQLPLYLGTGKGFIYLPHTAILYTPFILPSFAWSEALWRLLSMAVFTWGFFELMTIIPVYNTMSRQRQNILLLILTPLILLLCLDCIRNGQIHLLMTGLLMWATVNISRRQWLMATFLITLSFFLKPTAIVLLLLTAGVFPLETLLYFLMWITIFLLLPFLTQSWHYAASQYASWAHSLTIISSLGKTHEWPQFFNLFDQVGLDFSQKTQHLIRIVVALIVLGTGRWIKKHQNLNETSLWILMLSMIYLMLFNPRNENNDYMMLAPIILYGVIQTVANNKFYQLSFLIIVSVGLIARYYISKLFAGHHNWGAPLMTMLLLAYLITVLSRFHLHAKNLLVTCANNKLRNNCGISHHQ
jgi:alpha-1,2-mannosyltransferase